MKIRLKDTFSDCILWRQYFPILEPCQVRAGSVARHTEGWVDAAVKTGNLPRRGVMKILVILSSCAGGDWPPCLALAAGLHARGHDLLLVCDQGTATAVRAAGLPALCLPVRESLGRFFLPRLQRLLAGELTITGKGANPLAEWGRAIWPAVHRAMGAWRPSLIVGSLFCQYLAQRAASVWRVPWCCVNPSFSFGDRSGLARVEDFSTTGASMYQHWLLPPLCRADTVLHATDRVFDGASPTGPNHLYTGPLFWEMQGTVPPLLAEPGPPWILLSLSTAPQDGDLQIVHTAAAALQGKPWRVLVTLGPGAGREPPGALPDHMHITGYLPHSAVLPHCSMVISHGGHGLVLKTMCHGVPMVLVPWGRDQPGVAARAKRRGVARVVHRQDFSEKTLAEAVASLYSDAGAAEDARREARRLQAGPDLGPVWERLED